MTGRRAEILAPAGSYESMVAAVNAGADAVYIGGSRFGARAYANNLDEEAMVRAIDFAHLHGCRIYMTVNTLMKERELAELADYMRPYYEAGVDAVLVQDFGALSLLHETFPDLPLHISTQMTVTGPYSAGMLKKAGAVRVVPARELSLDEIRTIADTTGLEVETFVHGALCYCYSGQCLFSSLIGGRSGNRGRCAQTCRLPFDLLGGGKYRNRKNEKYLLSLKDLCTLDLLPDILEAGVCSLKIEGRMKSPRYTAGVVSIYRKYVDRYLEKGREGYEVEEDDRNALLSLFDRGGQSDGYYRRHNGRDMLVLKEKPAFREPDRELYDRLDRTYVNTVKKIPLNGTALFEAGKPAVLRAEYALRGEAKKSSAAAPFVQSEYGTVEEAKSAPMDAERIRRQLAKTGDSPFEFTDLDVTVRGNVFVPVQELNQMRRDILARTEQEILKRYRRTMKAPAQSVESGQDAHPNVHGGEREKDPYGPGKEQRSCPAGSGMPETVLEFNVLVNTREQFDTALRLMERWSEQAPREEDRAKFAVYLASEEFGAEDWVELVSRCHKKGVGCYLMMPRIFRNEAESYFLANLTALKAAGFDAAGVPSVEEPGFLAEYAPKLRQHFNFGMYAMNSMARAALAGFGASRITVPVELNSREIMEAGLHGELIVYGYLPVMVSTQCLKRTTEKCTKRTEILRLRDRMGKEFPVVNQCRFCYNTIYNESPLSLHGLSKEVKRLAPEALRLNFTVEDARTAETVMTAFYSEFILGKTVPGFPENFTRGHFRRGVE